MNVIKYPRIKNIKLRLQTHENCPKMLASFLFTILETRDEKLSVFNEIFGIFSITVLFEYHYNDYNHMR